MPEPDVFTNAVETTVFSTHALAVSKAPCHTFHELHTSFSSSAATPGSTVSTCPLLFPSGPTLSPCRRKFVPDFRAALVPSNSIVVASRRDRKTAISSSALMTLRSRHQARDREIPQQGHKQADKKANIGYVLAGGSSEQVVKF